MTPSNRRAAARLISHVLVGAAATVAVRQLLGRQAGAGASVLTFAVGILMHERLDAPLANVVVTLL